MKWIATRATLLLAAWTLAACVQIVQNPGPPEIEVKTPKPFLAEGPPALEPTEESDWFGAPSLDVSCYYYKPDKYWYRFFRNRWFQAFRWDGAWFELPDEEVPPFLQARAEIKPEIQQSKSKREKLDELQRQLEEIDRREREEAGADTPNGDAAPVPTPPSDPEERP